MRRFLLHGLCSMLILGSILVCSAQAAPPSQEDKARPRYPVFAYFVAGFSTLLVVFIAGLPSRKES